MGSSGPLASPYSTGHRKHPDLLTPQAPVEVPDPPDGLLAITRKDWVAFWSTPIAGLVQPADMPMLRYLFELQDRRERYLRASRGSKAISKGYNGQDVLNPLLKQLPSLNKEIRALQVQFGMTPTARARLGVAAGDGRPTLGQLLDRLDDEDVAAGDDPRLRVLEGTG